MKGYIVRLRRGKRAEAQTEKHAESVTEVECQKEQICQNWPQRVSKSLKKTKQLDCFEKKLQQQPYQLSPVLHVLKSVFIQVGAMMCDQLILT